METKQVARDTGLEALAMSTIPVGIGMATAGQSLEGLGVAAIGVALLIIKYAKRG
jgi:hypothetical protein